jgi:hypothetical protein
MVEKIFNVSTSDSTSYRTLRVLSNEYGRRLAGTRVSLRAIHYIKSVMEQSGFDTVYLQDCMVAHWDRGDQEIGEIISGRNGQKRVTVSALGNSVATPPLGISAEVVEVKSFEELDSLGSRAITGKIVFFNKSMTYPDDDPYVGYGSVVGLRFSGASVASRYGAVAVLVRSVTASIDTFPHTGVMRYGDEAVRIPALAISTKHADILSQWLENDPRLKFYMKANCQMLKDEVSYNVIGEVRGTRYPDEIITVGGHIDTWDNTPGAHDDGAGCVQSIDVWRILKQTGYSLQRTLRVVMFIDEEMNQRGGSKYAELARANNEKHILAIESDGGAGAPIGFSFDADSLSFCKIQKLSVLLEPYHANLFVNEGSGVDIEFLKGINNVILATLYADPAHYFDYHHSGFDTFQSIDYTSLQHGAAAMASLVYLVDRFGVN